MHRLAAIARLGTSFSAAILAAIVASLFVTTAADADEPVVTYQYPPEGEVFVEPLRFVQVCFDRPVDIRDLPPLDEGEFEFDMARPDGLGVGMRIVFQPNGYGVAVYPGTVEDGTEGPWSLTFQVRSQETLERLNHIITWQVQPDGKPIIRPTPAACPTTGEPPVTATPGPGDTPAPTGDVTPAPTGDDGRPDLDEESDVDILELALLTVGAAGGAAVLVLIGYFIRRRVGFWFHRPPEEDGDEESAGDEY